MGAIWKSGSRRFHQAGHALPELTQRIFPKGVVAAVEHHVSVSRRGYRHAAECEVAAQLVERRGGSCTPKRRHCTCRLAGELPSIHAYSTEHAVKQCEQRAVGSCEVDWRAHHEPIGSEQALDDLVCQIARKCAAARILAFLACDAPTHRLVPYPQALGFHAGSAIAASAKICHLRLEELVEFAINLSLALHAGVDDEPPSMNDMLYRAQRTQVIQRIASCDNHVSLLPHLD